MDCKYLFVGGYLEMLEEVLETGWAEQFLILPFLCFFLSSGKLLLSCFHLKVLFQEGKFNICLYWGNFGFLKGKKGFLSLHKGAELQQIISLVHFILLCAAFLI